MMPPARDVFVQGDCDAAVERMAKELGWFKELQRLEKAYRPPKDAQSLYGAKQKTNKWDDKVRLSFLFLSCLYISNLISLASLRRRCVSALRLPDIKAHAHVTCFLSPLLSLPARRRICPTQYPRCHWRRTARSASCATCGWRGTSRTRF